MLSLVPAWQKKKSPNVNELRQRAQKAQVAVRDGTYQDAIAASNVLAPRRCLPHICPSAWLRGFSTVALATTPSTLLPVEGFSPSARPQGQEHRSDGCVVFRHRQYRLYHPDRLCRGHASDPHGQAARLSLSKSLQVYPPRLPLRSLKLRATLAFSLSCGQRALPDNSDETGNEHHLHHPPQGLPGTPCALS